MIRPKLPDRAVATIPQSQEPDTFPLPGDDLLGARRSDRGQRDRRWLEEGRERGDWATAAILGARGGVRRGGDAAPEPRRLHPLPDGVCGRRGLTGREHPVWVPGRSPALPGHQGRNSLPAVRGAGGLELLVGAARLAGDPDQQALMDEAVGNGGGSGAVVKQLPPVLQGQVGGDDGGGPLVALVEDLVQEVRATGVEAEVLQLVNQQQFQSGPSRQAAVKGVAALAGDEVIDQVRGDDEADAATTEAGELIDGVGEMSLPDAAGADEDDVGLLLDEVQGGRTRHQLAVDALGAGQVEGVQGGEAEGWRPGGFQVARLTLRCR